MSNNPNKSDKIVKNMNEDLKYTFANINEWLKFAEAKNAGLLAINAATIIGILQADNTFTKDIEFFLGSAIFLLSISSCVCFYTILPILNKWFRFYKKQDDKEFKKALADNSLNALYFGDIVKLSSEQFVRLFEDKHNIALTKAEKDFANQITNNAEISWQKYKLFSFAAWLTFSAFVVAIILVIIKAI